MGWWIKTSSSILHLRSFGIAWALWQMFCPIIVMAQDYRTDVPVPAITIYPGDIVTDAMLTDAPKQVEASKIFAMQRSEVIGKQTRRTLLPGSLIPKNALVEPNVMVNGKLVTLRYLKNGLEITSTGLALQSATVGEIARARNVDSGLVVNGVVMADGSLNLGDP